MSLLEEIQRRRTFAIISHPDAGKTTITEKLLLFGGAIRMAGAVRARRAQRYATSDFLEMEKKRGISISTSVMSFDYADHLMNLLDTPGHEDFSEDTYRVLTAVDSALMVLDAAKGVETRTEKLMDVCRLRDTPVITFCNKLDREALDPFELMDNVEKKLNIVCTPFTWPIGMGQRFKGVYDLSNKQVIFYEAADRGAANERLVLDSLGDPRLEARVGEQAADQLRQDVELLEGACDPYNERAFLNGKQTPVFFGSAINNFGVKELLDCFVTIAPAPQPRLSRERLVDPIEEKLTGFVFKIQANLDPAHRDRMAFMRICSGTYTRGMKLRHVRTKKDIAVNNATVFLARERKVTEVAYPGDIIGLRQGGVRIGDTFSEGEALKFVGIPSFAPELFRRVVLRDPLKSKQLSKGLRQLCEEGAAKLFRPLDGASYIIGALGPLQFDVIKSRLTTEYKVRAEFELTDLKLGVWITAEDPAVLEAFLRKNQHRTYRDLSDNYAFLAQSAWAVNYAAEHNPELTFHKTIELD